MVTFVAAHEGMTEITSNSDVPIRRSGLIALGIVLAALLATAVFTITPAIALLACLAQGCAGRGTSTLLARFFALRKVHLF